MISLLKAWEALLARAAADGESERMLPLAPYVGQPQNCTLHLLIFIVVSHFYRLC